MTISVVINADTRPGYLTYDKSSIGEHFPGGQDGARSVDFLIEGVKNKMDFFRSYPNLQCVLYIDKHEEIPADIYKQVYELVFSYGNNSKLIIKEHNRTKHRWYDYIYIEALKQADGDYVAHFDCDTAAFKADGSNVVDGYLTLLDEGKYKYICYPTEQQPNNDYWASTRFFITKKETLHIEDLDDCLHNEYLAKTYGRISYNPFPCVLEHTLGLRVKEGEVLYPPREDDEYIIFCWVTYYKGTLKRLMAMPYEEVKKEICPDIAGANDYVDKNLNA